VVLEEILSEVILKISPDSVDMVGFILGVVIFENKGRSLDSIIVRLSPLKLARPSKM
jgi:hypothetical protein